MLIIAVFITLLTVAHGSPERWEAKKKKKSLSYIILIQKFWGNSNYVLWFSLSFSMTAWS